MAEPQLALKFLYCSCAFEAKPPDSWHIEYSFEEPPISDARGKVEKQKTICKNSECRKPITLYWYSPIECFIM